MSMPAFPDKGIDITRDQAFNMILGSIALEEIALSHIMNAESEKLKHFFSGRGRKVLRLPMQGADGTEQKHFRRNGKRYLQPDAAETQNVLYPGRD